jgi:polyvinyl alcohol dehydrogenase (cytochrome)
MKALPMALFGLPVLCTGLTLWAAPSPREAPQEAAESAAFANHPGKALFAENCAGCHEGGFPKAPQSYTLELMSPAGILSTLEDGIMKQQAAHLSHEQRVHISEYLTKTSLADYKAAPAPLMCAGDAKAFDLSKPPASFGWGYDNRRFIPAEVGGLTASDMPRLKLKWGFAFPGAKQARSQPVVAMGAVFVGSQDGTVYALDLATGCARWTAKVPAEVRTTIVVEPWDASHKAPRPRLFFGDLLGRVYALDALTGKELWRVRPDEHPNATITGTPVPFRGTLYVPVSSLEVGSASDPNYACCTFRGSLVALDSQTGKTRWQHFTVQRAPAPAGKTRSGTDIFAPSGAPVWGSPTIDDKRGLIYHGSGENYSSPADGNSDALFAVDMKTGQRRWVYQLTKNDAWNNSCMVKGHSNCPVQNGPDSDLAASILLVDIGGGRQALIAGAKSGTVTAVDPDANGKLLWKTQVGRGSLQGGIHFGMAAEGTRIYVPIYDSKDTSDGGLYTDPGFPGVHALDARSGRILWRGKGGDRCQGRKDCEAGVSAAITAIPGAVLAGYLDGWLRVHDGASGKVAWQVDTAQPVKTANGAVATGGSMSGPGPTLSDGHLILNSGYGFARKMPGNALLVYSIDGK